jgi:NAD-dependent DNA ligase
MIETMNFIYISAKGVVPARSLENASDSEFYVQGIDVASGRYKTFRKDRILEIIEDTGLQKQRLDYWLQNSPPPPPTTKNRKSKPSGEFEEICFTGFKSGDKKRVIEDAEKHDFLVRTAVTTKLTYLCYGPTAGPKKMEMARFKRVVIITEEQFKNLIEFGEVPDSADS